MIYNFNTFLNENNDECVFLNDSAKKYDYHQAILDVAYKFFKTDYTELINTIEDKFGDAFALLVMLGKYNQQVENGGHMALYVNNYIGTNNDLLDKTLLWFKKEKLDKTILGKKIYNIIYTANDILQNIDGNEICDECNGDGYVDVECEECNGSGYIDDDYDVCSNCNGSGYIDETCSSCNGNGYINNIDLYTYEINILDEQYYKYNKHWMSILNDFSHKFLIQFCGQDFDEKINKENKKDKYNL